MNKQGKNGIGWCDWTWNPIKGMCPVNCKLPDGKEYCYARKYYLRFKSCKAGFEGQGRIIHDEIYLHYPELRTPCGLKTPSKVFLCSTIELFHEKILSVWRDHIFNVIKDNPQHTFQILTKFPQNIDREMPENVHLGVTITGIGDSNRHAYIDGKARITFVSYEPLLSKPEWIAANAKWIIVGRLTGHGKKYDPTGAVLEDFANATEKYNIPLFMKNNLKEIWGNASLIQEFP